MKNNNGWDDRLGRALRGYQGVHVMVRASDVRDALEEVERWKEEWRVTEDARAEFENAYGTLRRQDGSVVITEYGWEEWCRTVENSASVIAGHCGWRSDDLATRALEDAAPPEPEMCCGGTCVRAVCPYHGPSEPLVDRNPRCEHGSMPCSDRDPFCARNDR